MIDGARHVVGSNRTKVNNAIAVSKAAKAKRVPVTLTPHAPDRLTVEIGETDGYYGNATVWLVAVDRQHTTPVNAGENRGRTLTNYNVVRDYRPIGRWTGGAVTIELGPDDLANLARWHERRLRRPRAGKSGQGPDHGGGAGLARHGRGVESAAALAARAAVTPSARATPIPKDAW